MRMLSLAASSQGESISVALISSPVSWLCWARLAEQRLLVDRTTRPLYVQTPDRETDANKIALHQALKGLGVAGEEEESARRAG